MTQVDDRLQALLNAGTQLLRMPLEDKTDWFSWVYEERYCPEEAAQLMEEFNPAEGKANPDVMEFHAMLTAALMGEHRLSKAKAFGKYAMLRISR